MPPTKASVAPDATVKADRADVPPSSSASVPVSTSTVPVLSNATSIVVVPVVTDLVSWPSLVNSVVPLLA